MFESVLSSASKKNLKILAGSPSLHPFYLAGGTGCALHLGHRISEDFVDLYFILKSRNMSLGRLFEFFDLKYGAASYNLYHVLKSLVYFEDAEKDPDPQIKVEFSWENLKSFFEDQVRGFKIP